jgi:hypothetical protein
MTQSHITTALNTIKGAVAPAKGEIVFDLGFGIEGFGGLYTAAEAVRVILDNPRVEFKPVSFWQLV